MCDDDLFEFNTNTDDLLDYVSDGDIISTEAAPLLFVSVTDCLLLFIDR